MGKIDRRDPVKEKVRKHDVYLRNKEKYLAKGKKTRQEAVLSEAQKLRHREWKRAWYQANKTRLRVDAFRNVLPRKYGITESQYRKMIDDQCGMCLLCECVLVPGRHTHVDHDHATGRVRGVLCASCNVRLGALESNGLLWLAKAVAHAWPGIAWPPIKHTECLACVEERVAGVANEEFDAHTCPGSDYSLTYIEPA